MRTLAIWLVLVVILPLAVFAADKSSAEKAKAEALAKDKAAAEAVFDLVNFTFDSWYSGECDLDGQHKVKNRYLEFDKLIGPDGVNFVLIVPEIKVVNKKSVCVVSTKTHRISAATFHKAIKHQYQITDTTTNNSLRYKQQPPLNDKEVVLLEDYVANYAMGEGEGDLNVVPSRKSIGEWWWPVACYFTPIPKPRPIQHTKLIKNNGAWQLQEIQILLRNNVRMD